jgi:hypothetical protein
MNNEFRLANCAYEAALGICVIFCLSGPVSAQAPRGNGPASTTPEGIIVGGAPPPAPRFERCIEVEIGGDHSLGCLNQQLKREAERVNPSLNVPPLDARSPDTRVGNANEAAVRQQYGSNYGRSVYPFRPPAPVFTVPRR